ncbi:MAG: solute-binding protein [Planctomycetota bacterium]|nr:MAG: solute-binding protein [Planctomycetota bacterium]
MLAVREGFGEAPPSRLRDLTGDRFRGRVGMARPRFGTTRGHMGALLATAGTAVFRAWLEAMAANGLRLYDGNSTVVRAVTEGELDVCLTDTDDVWAQQLPGRGRSRPCSRRRMRTARGRRACRASDRCSSRTPWRGCAAVRTAGPPGA